MLEPDSRHILTDAADQVESSAGPDHQWSVSIQPNNPVRFLPSETDERIRPDLFCELKATDGPWPFSEQAVVLRVWSEEIALSYRSEWDSSVVEKTLSLSPAPRRVMVRMHFDRAPIGADEPRFHLQLGGRTKVEKAELHWHPPTLRVPRIPMPPLELVMVCEIVVSSFFPGFYATKKQEPQWRALIHRAQSFASTYYDLCHACCRANAPPGPSLLEQLWNT